MGTEKSAVFWKNSIESSDPVFEETGG